MNASDVFEPFSIKALFEGADDYFIPMYQRNYAWDESEITQLIQDVIDYAPEGKDYYIGSLVVSERAPNLFEVIDGQQRLTTLSLLLAYLKETDKDASDWVWYNPGNQKQKLRYESRDYSGKAFEAIFEGKNIFGLERDAIVHGYILIREVLPKKLKGAQNLDQASFSKFLLKNVQIMRVRVPKDTDLNHYFEIMNSRGEQLEKHEVLKAELMAALNNNITDEAEKKSVLHCLHVIWEACANMEKYVQQGFAPEVQTMIFGYDGDTFIVKDFESVRKALCEANANEKNENQTGKQSLKDIIDPSVSHQSKQDGQREKDKDVPDRFHAVINFPNFLLQVLCVTTGGKVPLDDKKLIDLFRKHLLKEGDIVNHVKQFIFDLLRCKYLFDHYVIKRDFRKYQEGRWSLKRYKKSSSNFVDIFGKVEQEDATGGENRRILMLLAAFHISTPTMNYKYWLNAALRFLFTQSDIGAQSYLGYLESVARSFVFDRYLAQDGEAKDYLEIIYNNSDQCQSNKAKLSDELLKDKLSYGNIKNNLVFNYLDYLLWCNDQYPKNGLKPTNLYGDFEFTPRSSVEHLSPQTPFSGEKPIENVDSFGNLCLISHRRNSTLSNRSPMEKREYYIQSKITDSIKQMLMFAMMNQYGAWGKESIEEHFQTMKTTLLESLDG